MDSLMFNDDYLWSKSWKYKDPSEWTMSEVQAYEFQMMCKEHDEQLEKDK